MTDSRRTPLHALHVELGARMVTFAGWEMPVQFPTGVMQEHHHTRVAAGLFDVSHMGQVVLRGPDPAALATGLERLVPQDVAGLAAGRQRYAFFTNAQGGIEDDLMVANRGDHLFLVVNAARRDADLALLRAGLEPEGITVKELEGRALLALQGPRAETVLAKLNPDVAAMHFMDVGTHVLAGAECWVSRSGYTGEDGFEISVPSAAAETLARALLANPDVEPVGLGARDSLRLEAGLCLYGADIDAETSPAEAGLGWAIQKARRTGGAREGGFPGAARILAELSGGAACARVGLRPQGRAPMRAGVDLFESEEAAAPVGRVTSGGFGPTYGAPVAMGYVPSALARQGRTLWGELRGKRLPVTVTDLPFVPANFKR
ncbi:MAG: glycine cleavage system aminomethyltransferase GcvT [Paracoccaceae bacterium]